MNWSSYFWVRSAGFPCSGLDRLAVLTGSAELAAYEQSEDELSAIEQELMSMAALLAAPVAAKLGRRFAEVVGVQASELPVALREGAGPLLMRRTEILLRQQERRAALQASFDAQALEARHALIELLRQPMVREAIFLSNPEALQRVDSLAERNDAPLDSRARQRLRLGWNYLQRLCAKNDTASFFGPIAWGRFAGRDAPAIAVVRQAGAWLSDRKTFFEHWVVLRLCEAIAHDPALHDALPLAMSEGCDLSDGVLHYPLGKRRVLDPLSRTLMERIALAGRQGVSRGELRAEGRLEGDASTRLDLLLQKKIVVRGFSIPPGLDDPLGVLARCLSGLAVEAEVLAPFHTLFATLERLRLQFAHGDLETRIASLEAMRQALADVGIDLTRDQGRMYVGRFPVYEDCARNLHVVLGGSVADLLDGPMTQLMHLHDWLAGAAAVRLHDRYLESWRALCGAAEPPSGEANVDFLLCLSALQQRAAADEVVRELRQILQVAWRETTRCYRGDAIELTPADLHALAARLDACEPRARHFHALGTEVHSPDFLIAAESEEAIRRGEYSLVIGEVHPAVHTVSQPVAQPFCPYVREIRDEVGRLLDPQTVVVADSASTYQRSHIDWLAIPGLIQLRLPEAGVPQQGTGSLPAGRGEVVLRQGVLTYRDRSAAIEEDLLTVLPSELHRVCFSLAAELLGQSLAPRLSLGRIVLKRRSWYVAPQDLPRAAATTESLDGYLAWRRWARGLGLPRHVFIKVASEPKPIYVDFDNPQSLDLLASLVKKAEPLRLSEMRPTPAELWLKDERGAYCAEFRTSFARRTRAPRAAEARPSVDSAVTAVRRVPPPHSPATEPPSMRRHPSEISS